MLKYISVQNFIKIQVNFDISNSYGMGKTLRVFRSSRIHVHEQKCVHFRLNTLSSFCKIGIATKRLYVCNPLCTTRTFLPTNIGVR